MFSRRFQLVLDEERYERIAKVAARKGVPVSRVIRDAIDTMLPATGSKKQAAARRILAADLMPVPSVDALHKELDDLRGRRG